MWFLLSLCLLVLHVSSEEDKKKLLEDSRYCGYQHSDDYERYEDNTSTRLSEFPWLAGLIYENEGKPLCGGSLISKKYILTAAHCVESRTPISVVLGEYDTHTQMDCVEETPFEKECNEPLQVFTPEKIIKHSGYDKKINDIALIRLNDTVVYTDFVRPVCLIFAGTKFAQVGDVMMSSGWGVTKPSGDLAKIKKRNRNTLAKNEVCAHAYSGQVSIEETHLCALPSNGSFECQGDGGGPLSFNHRFQWYQAGIISFGSGCGDKAPNVYTRVSSYLDWILENLEE